MTAHPDPQARELLAREMLGLARTGPGPIAFVDKTQLHNYAQLAEEMIQQQGRMLARDQTENPDQAAEITRLRTENTTLRQLAEAALTAADLHDGEGLDLIRQALERTQ